MTFWRIAPARRFRPPAASIPVSAALLVLAASAAAISPARRTPEAADRILLRSMLAPHNVNIRGRQMEVISSPRGATRFFTKEIARARDGRSMARCLSPSEQRGVVKVDDGAWTRSFDPAKGVVEISRSLPRIRSEAQAMRMIRRIRANYHVSIHNSDFIAGRTCDVVELKPRDPYAHAVKYWIDRKTGFTLARQESGRHNETLGLTAFTTVSFPAKLADSEVSYRFPKTAHREKLSQSGVYRDLAPLRKRAGFELFLPLAMPAGFEFESCELAVLNGAPVACLRFTDGVAVITICQNWLRDAARADARSLSWQPLPRGEFLVMTAANHTSIMVMGPREPDGLLPIARAMDNQRERAWLARLAREGRQPLRTLEDLRSRGMGLDHMAALLAISLHTGKPFTALAALHRQGWSCASIAARLKVNFAQMMEQARPYQCR